MLLSCEGEQDEPGSCHAEQFTMTQDPQNASAYRFKAETARDEVLYHWSINDTLAGDAASSTFEYDFLLDTSGKVPGGPGEYTICLSVISPECQKGTTLYCETITIGAPDTCPVVDLLSQETEPGTFQFTSNKVEEGIYYWFIDDVLSGDAGSNIFKYNFLLDNSGKVPYGPGDYEICLRVVTPDCPEGAEKVCKTVHIPSPGSTCPEAEFISNQSPPDVFKFMPGVIKFTSTFEDQKALYYWYLDGELSGDAAKHYFEYDFSVDPGSVHTGPGKYEVCLKVVTPDCPEGSNLFCETVVIKVDNSCPEVEFTTEETKHGQFKFTSTNIGTALYYWYIDGKLSGDAGSNTFEYDFLLDTSGKVPGGYGDYEICLRVATPECNTGSELYCTTVSVIDWW